MEVGFKEPSSDQVLAVQIVDLLLTDEPVLVINHFAIDFLQLFCHVLQVWNPTGCGTQFRDEVATDLRILQPCED